MSKNSFSPGSPTNSLKKLKSKVSNTDDLATPSASSVESAIHENFVLMSTPDKFKDSPEEDSSVQKTKWLDTSIPEVSSLECLLLADLNKECVPRHLQNILKFYHKSTLSQGELLFLLVYVIALETGFAEKQHFKEVENILCLLPATSSFHSKNILHLSLLKPSYIKNEEHNFFSMKLCSIVDIEKFNEKESTNLLLGCVTGDLMIITLSPDISTGAKGFSVAISMGRFILSVQKKNGPIYRKFNKLDELSLLLRNNIFVPMRNQNLYRLNAAIIPTLDGMPAELYDNILKYLSVNQMKILANVSKNLNDLTRNNKRLKKLNKSN